MLIGREKEIKTLQKAYHSEYSEFVADYGRRCIGKTFLIREAFNYQFALQHTSVYKETLKKQLRNFRDALKDQEVDSPNNNYDKWRDTQ